jgi:hypothetical protein
MTPAEYAATSLDAEVDSGNNPLYTGVDPDSDDNVDPGGANVVALPPVDGEDAQDEGAPDERATLSPTTEVDMTNDPLYHGVDPDSDDDGGDADAHGGGLANLFTGSDAEDSPGSEDEVAVQDGEPTEGLGVLFDAT